MSDDLGSFLTYAYNIPQLNATNPTEVWELIRWNPWAAMAVYSDMEEKDGVVASSLDTRKDGVLAKSRRILPANSSSQDKKAADLVAETLEGYFDPLGGGHTGLDQILFELLDAVGCGVSIGEIIWGDGGDRVYIKDVKFKPPHLFAFGETALAAYSTASYMLPQTGPLRLRYGMMGKGIGLDGKLPEKKFVTASFRPRYSNRWGSPQLRKAFWASWFKRAGVKTWLKTLEKGNGTVVTRYPDGAQADEKGKALLAAQAIAEEAFSAMPQKFTTEVLQHVRQSGGMSHSEFVDDFCNSEIERVILGQTGSSGRSSQGWSKGDHQQQVRAEKIEADAKFLMMVVNMSFIWPLTLFNIGPVKRPPIWTINYEPQRDLSAFSNWLARLWTMRLPIPKNFVYNTFQVPEPAEDEETLEPPQSGEKPSIPESGVDSSADFAETQKKTPKFEDHLKRQSRSKMERFSRLRPSMIED